MKKFVLETCSSILEKYADYSMVRCVSISIFLTVSCFQCAEIIKNMMDENYGGAGYWNVIVGESFDVGYLHFKSFMTEIRRLTVPMTREARC